MSGYGFEAVDATGQMSRGTLNVTDQSEALKRIKEMGLFPVKVARAMPMPRQTRTRARRVSLLRHPILLTPGRVKPAALTVFTRQLATLIGVGMPLLRGLRILGEQAESPALKRVIAEIAATIETRRDVVRSAGGAPAGLQRSLREHGQGGRAWRHFGRGAATAGRIHGEDAPDQGQGQGGAVLPCRFRAGDGRGHP